MLIGSYVAKCVYAAYRLFQNGTFVELRIGDDAAGFFRVARESYIGYFENYVMNYPHILNAEFHVFGVNYFCAMLVNVLLESIAAVAVCRALTLLEVQGRPRRLGVLVISFAPYVIISSSEILREPVYTCFISLSLCVFVSYLRRGGLSRLVRSVLLMMPVIALHGGYFPIAVTYLALGGFSHRPGGLDKDNLLTRIVCALLIVVSIAVVGAIDPKGIMNSLGNPEELLDRISGNSLHRTTMEAGSAYLLWLKTPTWPTAILASPLKALFYLLSPLPMNWRWITDIVAFLLNSSVHLFFLFAMYRLFLKDRSPRSESETRESRKVLWTVAKAVLVSVLLCAVLFGFDTHNAGTALRHRDAVIPMEAVGISICMALMQSGQNSQSRRKSVR